MTEDLLKHVGPRVAHVTASENVEGILANGLLSAEQLARRAKIDLKTLPLRSERLCFSYGEHRTRLNHQRPISQNINAANLMLEGHTPETWAQMLDKRIFFWPKRRYQRFAKSIARDTEIKTLWIDTEALLEGFLEFLDLSPLNSGNFSQGGAHAPRGDWLFVPASSGLKAFRQHRRKRGLVLANDSVQELSLRCAIPAQALNRLILEML